MLVRSGAGRKLAEREIRLRQHHTQYVVEVMRDATRKASHGFQLLPGYIFIAAMFKVGNVAAVADEAYELPVGPESRYTAAEQPPIFTILPLVTVLHMVRSAFLERGFNRRDAPFEIVGMHATEPAPTQFLLQRPAGKIKPTFIQKSTASVRAGHPDHQRRGIGQISESFLALAPGGFLPKRSKLRDILADARESNRMALRITQWSSAPLHPTVGSVLG